MGRGLDVAVIGGGLGGLAVAIGLERTGHRPVVYEQTAQFRAAGAGISLWPNGVKVLGSWGLEAPLAALGGRMDRMGYADHVGKTLTEFSLLPLYETVGARAWPVARADLQDLLVEAVGIERIRFGARGLGVTGGGPGRGVTVHLADGSQSVADLVVGADGTHSTLRSWVAGVAVERRSVGYVNVNGIVAADEAIAPPGLWQTWVGGGKRVSVMPIGGERMYAFFDIPGAAPSGGPVVDELEDAFAGWASPVRRLIEAVDAERFNRVAIHELPTVDRWSRDRVVLLGDAVHAMAPDLGQGGCQALEDALVLSRLLAETGSGDDQGVDAALVEYEEERRPRTSDIVRRARQRAALTHGEDPAATRAWYRSLGRGPGEAIIAGLIQSVVTGPCG